MGQLKKLLPSLVTTQSLLFIDWVKIQYGAARACGYQIEDRYKGDHVGIIKN